MNQSDRKYYLFGDERIKDKTFHICMYALTEEKLKEVEARYLQFKSTFQLSPASPLHYNSDTRTVRRNFTSFIRELPLDYMIHTSTTHLSFPDAYIACFQSILFQLKTTITDSKIIPFHDQLGGKKSEQLLRTEFSRAARLHDLNLHKSLRFLDSRRSPFIQMADYCVALQIKPIIKNQQY